MYVASKLMVGDTCYIALLLGLMALNGILAPGTVMPSGSAMLCGNTTFRGHAMHGKSIFVKELKNLASYKYGEDHA